MKREIRIKVEGNSGDGFIFRPVFVFWGEDNGNSYITSIPSDFSGKEDIATVAQEIIDACKKPCIYEKNKIYEVQQ